MRDKSGGMQRAPEGDSEVTKKKRVSRACGDLKIEIGDHGVGA